MFKSKDKNTFTEMEDIQKNSSEYSASNIQVL